MAESCKSKFDFRSFVCLLGSTSDQLAPCSNSWEPPIFANFGFERIHLLMALPSVFFMSVDVTFLRDFKSEGSKFILNSYRRLSHLRRKKKKLIGTEKEIFAGSLPRFREREKKSPKFETGKLFESNRPSCLKVKPKKLTCVSVRPILKEPSGILCRISRPRRLRRQHPAGGRGSYRGRGRSRPRRLLRQLRLSRQHPAAHQVRQRDQPALLRHLQPDRFKLRDHLQPRRGETHPAPGVPVPVLRQGLQDQEPQGRSHPQSPPRGAQAGQGVRGTA